MKNFAGINNIRLEGIFGAFLQKHLLSFRMGTMPKDIHFTLVFDEKHADINLHITRNVSGPSKPKIGIVKVNRQLLLGLAEEISLKLLYSLLEPIDMKLLSRNTKSLGFISFDEAERGGMSQKLYESWTKPLKSFTKVKGKRLKVTGEYRKAFDESLAEQIENQKALYNILQPIGERYEKDIESGIIIADDSCRFTVRIYGTWYFFKTDFTMFDVLNGLTNRQTAYNIICKIDQALEIIQTAESYDQTEMYDKPLRLEAINPEYQIQ